MVGKIYKITNSINSKVYVGQTIKTLRKRFLKHCNMSEVETTTMAIKKAIHKYGKDKFNIELIEECDISNLNEREIYWISYYDSYRKGYNCTEGGQLGTHKRVITEEEELLLCNLYKSGKNSNELASVFNVDKTTILNYIKKNDIKVNNRVLENRVDVNEFKQYIKDNFPTALEVSHRFNISRCSVYNLLRELGDESLILNNYNPRISNAKKQESQVCRLYLSGYNIKDLIKHFHSSKRYISKILKDNGIKVERNRKSIEYNISTSVQTLASRVEG